MRHGLAALAVGALLATSIVGPANADHEVQLAYSSDCAFGVPVQAMPGQSGLAYAASIQEELNIRGYNAGPVDGIVGSKTRRAIRHYQKDYGLPVDGCATRELLEHLKFVAPRPSSGAPRDAGHQYAHNNEAPFYDSYGYQSYGYQPEYEPEPYAGYAPPRAPIPYEEPYIPAPSYGYEPLQGPAPYDERYAPAPPYGNAPQSNPVPFAEPSDGPQPAPSQSQQAYNLPSQTYEPPPPQYDPYGPASRSLVMEIQQELYLRGYYSGAIDGVAGRQTMSAAERFQSDAGYPPSGEITQALLNQLRSADESIRY
jgi:peptidoglycan hydrolase-like protein with peptidoglycan-binding domain